MKSVKQLYRVVNESDELEEVLDSTIDITSRQQITRNFLSQIKDILTLSLKCDLKLSSALRIASQYGNIIEKILAAKDNRESEIALSKFLVFDEKKTSIPLDIILEFVYSYNQVYQDTGLYLDEDCGDGQYIWEGVWEVVRQLLFSDKNSRLESIFAFDNLEDAFSFVRISVKTTQAFRS